MAINTRKNSFDEIPPDSTNKTTPTKRKLRSKFILDRQNSTSLQNGLDLIKEEEEEEDERDDEEEVDDSSEEMDDSSEEEDDDDGDEYEEDFVDDETEDSEDSQETYLPSTLNSDNDSNEAGSGNEDEALSLVEELENLGITPHESNN